MIKAVRRKSAYAVAHIYRFQMVHTVTEVFGQILNVIGNNQNLAGGFILRLIPVETDFGYSFRNNDLFGVTGVFDKICAVFLKNKVLILGNLVLGKVIFNRIGLKLYV